MRTRKLLNTSVASIFTGSQLLGLQHGPLLKDLFESVYIPFIYVHTCSLHAQCMYIYLCYYYVTRIVQNCYWIQAQASITFNNGNFGFPLQFSSLN